MQAIKVLWLGPVDKENGTQEILIWLNPKATPQEIGVAFEKWVKENRPKEWPEPQR